MQELEKILEEIEQLVNMHYENDSVKIIILRKLRGIRKHMIDDKCAAKCSRRKWYQQGYEDGKNNNDGWIPVEERLPEESLNSVIGWDEYRERCCFVQYYAGKWALRADREPIHIIAWRPLPEPYRPERSDDK